MKFNNKYLAFIFSAIGLYVVLSLFLNLVNPRSEDSCFLIGEKKLASPNSDYNLTMDQRNCSKSGNVTTIVLRESQNLKTGQVLYESRNSEYIEDGMTYLFPPVAATWTNNYEILLKISLDNHIDTPDIAMDKVRIDVIKNDSRRFY